MFTHLVGVKIGLNDLAGTNENSRCNSDQQFKSFRIITIIIGKNGKPFVVSHDINEVLLGSIKRGYKSLLKKESETAYEMELTAPGIKKEYCRVSINDDGNLCIAIEKKMEHKEEDKKHHYLRREFSYSNYEQSYTRPEYVDNQLVAAQLQAQQRIGSNHYVQVRIAGAQLADKLKELLDHRTLFGVQAAYYYNTIFGPAGATFGYSNRTKKVHFYVNLGFVF